VSIFGGAELGCYGFEHSYCVYSDVRYLGGLDDAMTDN